MSIVDFDNNVTALTDVGLVRPHNEDSNRVAKTINGELFVVCDGMGGHVGGATASKIGVDSICSYVNEHECAIPQQFLVKALEYANSQIYSESRANPELRGMGTTACVALVRDDKVWYAHVGDSRIYYYNAKQRGLYRLTKDHSVVQALVDQGLITEAEAEHHPDKNKIRKSLGIKEDVEPEPCQMPLIPAEGDILLICSDGLSGMMSEDDILEVLSTTPDTNEAGKILVELAKSGGGTDNITVQLVKFSNVGTREAVFDPKNKGITRDYKNGTSKEGGKRLRWPWVIIAVSCVLLFIAIIILIPKKGNAPAMDIDEPQPSVAEEYAYKKIVGNREYKVFFDNNTEYHLYENVDGQKDLCLKVKDNSYVIGEYEYLPDGKKYDLILETKQFAKKFHPNGKEKL